MDKRRIKVSIVIAGMIFVALCVAHGQRGACASAPETAYLTQALSQEVQSAPSENNLRLPNVLSMAVRMAVSLIVVLGLAIGAIYVMRKLYGNALFSGSRRMNIRVLAQRRLDAKHAIFVVDILGRTFVLGSGEGGISLIAEIPASGTQTQPSSFWQQIISKKKESRPEEVQFPQAGDSKWREKIEALKKVVNEP